MVLSLKDAAAGQAGSAGQQATPSRLVSLCVPPTVPSLSEIRAPSWGRRPYVIVQPSAGDILPFVQKDSDSSATLPDEQWVEVKEVKDKEV